MTRSTRALPLALAALSLAACGSRAIPIEIDFTPDALADDATALELFVVDRCSDVTRGELPASPRASLAFRRDETPSALPEVLPERFGVAVIARGDGCGVIGAGCVDASRDVASLRIEVTAVTSDVRCVAGEACDDGLCVTGAVDAGTDATSHDAFAAGDVPDASRDAGVEPSDAFAPELACDCADDDSDGTVDEGCTSEVLWQTPIDSIGRQALRGAARGGDGRVYVNGWMDTLGMDATLCGRGPFRASGPEGPSYTLGLDATTGACMSVLERVVGSAAPPSPFAFPQPGRRGVWLFAQTEIVELVGTNVVANMTLNDSASFNVGDVLPRPGPSDDLLVHYWANPAIAPQLLGMNVGMLGSDPIALIAGGSVGSTHVPRDTSIGWLGEDRFFVVGPSAAAPGFPCSNAADHATTGPLRVEVRYAEMMDWCERAIGLPTDPSGARERVSVAAGDRVWSLFLFDDHYVVTVADLSTDTVAELTIEDAPLGSEADTITHLAPLSGGDVAVGGGRARVVGGMRDLEGFVARFGFEGGAIVERTRRTVGNGVVGLGVAPDRDVVYVTSHVSRPEALCAGAVFTPDVTAAIVSAIDLDVR